MMDDPLLYYPPKEKGKDIPLNIDYRVLATFVPRLASGIAEAAKKAGIYNGEVPLDGPQLMMLLDDMATSVIEGRAKSSLNVETAMAMVESYAASREASSLHTPAEWPAHKSQMDAQYQALRQYLAGFSKGAFRA